MTHRKLTLRDSKMISSTIYGEIHPEGRFEVFSNNVIIPAMYSMEAAWWKCSTPPPTFVWPILNKMRYSPFQKQPVRMCSRPSLCSRPTNNPNNFSIKKVVDYYGVELKIIINYEDAIIELTKQTKKGFCDYYAFLVILCSSIYSIT